MGWGTGTNAAGRDVGYMVQAECDEPGCTVEIDRGIAYVCGGMHDGGEHGCGRYFCGEHLGYVHGCHDAQLCDACHDSWEAAS